MPKKQSDSSKESKPEKESKDLLEAEMEEKEKK